MRRHLMTLLNQKRALSIILLTSLSCASLPNVPHHVQYGVHADVNPPGFYGVDNETKMHFYKPFLSADMKAAQCLTIGDYEAMQHWLEAVRKIAEEKCR